MKNLFLTILFFSLSFLGMAQSGKVYENLTMKSDILKMDRKFSIYLPPGYETSEREYPVLYLLHGAGDDHTGWVQFGEVLHIADKAMIEGSATDMIVVMSDANTRQGGYFNSINNDWHYEDFFFQEFMPFVENEYRIRKEKRYRAIAGLSMGGGGTFVYALRHPELFSSACPLSASCGPLNMDEMERYKSREGMKDASNQELATYYKKHSVVDMMKNLPDEQKKAVRWFIDCGDDDFLYEGNSLVHIEMRKNEIPHEYRVRDGGHTWSYWRESLPVVLSFITDSFHQF